MGCELGADAAHPVARAPRGPVIFPSPDGEIDESFTPRAARRPLCVCVSECGALSHARSRIPPDHRRGSWGDGWLHALPPRRGLASVAATGGPVMTIASGRTCIGCFPVRLSGLLPEAREGLYHGLPGIARRASRIGVVDVGDEARHRSRFPGPSRATWRRVCSAIGLPDAHPCWPTFRRRGGPLSPAPRSPSRGGRLRPTSRTARAGPASRPTECILVDERQAGGIGGPVWANRAGDITPVDATSICASQNPALSLDRQPVRRVPAGCWSRTCG